MHIGDYVIRTRQPNGARISEAMTIETIARLVARATGPTTDRAAA